MNTVDCGKFHEADKGEILHFDKFLCLRTLILSTKRSQKISKTKTGCFEEAQPNREVLAKYTRNMVSQNGLLSVFEFLLTSQQDDQRSKVK